MTRRAGAAAAPSNASSGRSTARSSSFHEVTTGSPASNRAVASSTSPSTRPFPFFAIFPITFCLSSCATPDPAISRAATTGNTVCFYIQPRTPIYCFDILACLRASVLSPIYVYVSPSIPFRLCPRFLLFLTSVCRLSFVVPSRFVLSVHVYHARAPGLTSWAGLIR